MTIVIDATPAIQQQGGIGRYVEELARSVAQELAGEELRLFSSDPRRTPPRPPLDTLARTDHPRPAKLWRASVALATWIGRPMDGVVGPGDVFHATDHVLPPFRRKASVFTLYDLTHLVAPETQTAPNREFLRAMIPRFLKNADLVVAISESTRLGALEHYDLAPSKIRTVLLGTPRGMEPVAPALRDEVRRRLGLPQRYFLCVATFEPRKNHALLFRALAELDDPSARLVLVGKRGWKHEDMQQALARSGVAEQVMILENVANADLPAIYSGAELFLFPSLYEGFGFPILEAMACGTPVLASNASSLPEVAGGAARLLPTDDASAWAAAIRELRDDAAAGDTMRRRGLERARELTWERTARATLALYREAHDRRS